jgi:hypothetical protein
MYRINKIGKNAIYPAYPVNPDKFLMDVYVFGLIGSRAWLSIEGLRSIKLFYIFYVNRRLEFKGTNLWIRHYVDDPGHAQMDRAVIRIIAHRGKHK